MMIKQVNKILVIQNFEIWLPDDVNKFSDVSHYVKNQQLDDYEIFLVFLLGLIFVLNSCSEFKILVQNSKFLFINLVHNSCTEFLFRILVPDLNCRVSRPTDDEASKQNIGDSEFGNLVVR